MNIAVGSKSEERQQFFSPYLQRELSLQNEAAKQPCREKILAHILDHHSSSRMIFFGFPGVRWAFERQLENAFPAVTFIGVERNWSILQQGLSFMPGYKRWLIDESLRTTRLQGYKSETARILWGRAGTILNFGRQEKTTKRGRKEWLRKYKKWTALWLDFHSLNNEAIRCLHRIDAHCDMRCPVIPFAVTVMMGREQRSVSRAMNISEARDPSIRRMELIKAILASRRYRSFELSDSFTYRSGHVTMLTILGKLISKGIDHGRI